MQTATLLLSLLVATTAPNSAQIEAAKKVNAAGGGVSLVILHQGKVIAEDYPNGGSASRPRELASGTKSFSGVMALAAEEDGLLKLDEKVADTLTEWQADRRKEITIRQLLQLVGGLPSPPTPLRGGTVPTYSEAANTLSNADTGQRFQYGATPFMAFGELMKRKLAKRNETVEGYMKRRILDPLKVNVAFWRKDADGNPHLPSGMALTARDWAQFGEMVRLDGKGVLKPGRTAELFKGSTANPSYGLTWWMPPKNGQRGSGRIAFSYPDDLPADLVQAAGAGGQLLMIIPSRELVIVRQAPVRGNEDRFQQVAFLRALLSPPAK